jgi:hypothetical protein
MATCDQVMNNLISSFGAGVQIESVNGACVVVTPLLRSNFDHVQFYVETFNGRTIVSDEGETIADLLLHGIDVSEDKSFNDEIIKIAHTYRLTYRDYVLSTQTTDDLLGETSLRLLNAIQAVGYLIYKRSSRPRSTFINQVETFFLEHQVPYESQKVIPGRTISNNRFHYYINGQRNIAIDALSTESPDRAKSFAVRSFYKINDVRESGNKLNYAAVLDDRRGMNVWTDSEAMSILHGHDIPTIPWTQLDQLLPLISSG